MRGHYTIAPKELRPVLYVVPPASGTQAHVTLNSLAEKYLGDLLRDVEIGDLNSDVLGDGLGGDVWLRPGTQLVIVPP